MKAPTPLKQNSVAVADVIVRDRLRPVSDAGVAALIASITETGIMKDAIQVRKLHNGQLRLMAGAHRLAAAKELGWEEIEAKIYPDVTDDWARLIEIDDNLAGAEMNPLDTAVFIATRRAVHERLYPEAKQGSAGAHARWNATDTVSVASFIGATAEKFCLSERHVYRMAAVGSRLHPDEINQLRLAPRPVTLADLQEISKIGEAPERYEVVRMLATGEARGAAKARKAYRHRDNPPVHSDPIDVEFLAMRKLWDRSHKAAKIRLVRSLRKDLTEMLADLDEREGI